MAPFHYEFAGPDGKPGGERFRARGESRALPPLAVAHALETGDTPFKVHRGGRREDLSDAEMANLVRVRRLAQEAAEAHGLVHPGGPLGPIAIPAGLDQQLQLHYQLPPEVDIHLAPPAERQFGVDPREAVKRAIGRMARVAPEPASFYIPLLESMQPAQAAQAAQMAANLLDTHQQQQQPSLLTPQEAQYMADLVAAQQTGGSRRRRRRKTRGRKARGRKARGRKPRGRKTRGRHRG